MGETVKYMGHVSIVPGLNQSEYDHLFGLTEPWLRSTGRRRRDQPEDSSGWEPCGHGCCLSWNGREKFHSAVGWMDYLIGDLLRPGAMARTSKNTRFADFTFDHHLDGTIVGQRSWSRQLFAIRVEDNTVSQEILERGDPLEWEPGWDEDRYRNRPWFARDRESWRSALDDPPPELAALTLVSPFAPAPAKATSKPRRRRSPVIKVEPCD